MKSVPLKSRAAARSHAAEELIRRHQASVRGFLVFLGCPAKWLDDLVQDVFLSLISSPFEHRNDPQTASWLRTVARNLFLKTLRRERREPPLADLDAAERAWVGFEAEDGGEGYLAALRQCLAGVSERARRVLELRYGARRKRDAIAGELGMSEAGVKSILVRSKQKLRDCIERRLVS